MFVTHIHPLLPNPCLPPPTLPTPIIFIYTPPLLQCLEALLCWARSRPDVIGGVDPADRRLKRLRYAIQTSLKYWNKEAGILRPRKATALLLDHAIPLLKSLDLRDNVDLRDALIFTISFSSGTGAKEVVNITWKDVTVLEGGKAVLLNIRPTKNSTEFGSTHTAQFGRRSFPEVKLALVAFI